MFYVKMVFVLSVAILIALPLALVAAGLKYIADGLTFIGMMILAGLDYLAGGDQWFVR
jgi:hypothetical protein